MQEVKLTETDFKQFCYELYKIDWLQHISTEKQLCAMRDWYDKQSNTTEKVTMTYFGTMYKTYEEFLVGEFCNALYMMTLLNTKEYAYYVNCQK